MAQAKRKKFSRVWSWRRSVKEGGRTVVSCTGDFMVVETCEELDSMVVRSLWRDGRNFKMRERGCRFCRFLARMEQARLSWVLQSREVQWMWRSAVRTFRLIVERGGGEFRVGSDDSWSSEVSDQIWPGGCSMVALVDSVLGLCGWPTVRVATRCWILSPPVLELPSVNLLLVFTLY